MNDFGFQISDCGIAADQAAPRPGLDLPANPQSAFRIPQFP
jgi:hypothetical protein